MERANHPNKGLLSPPGGKLRLDDAESPFICSVRESNEECGIVSEIKDWKLIGLITEKEYPNIGNIMIFMMEYQRRLEKLPAHSIEGNFLFVPAVDIMESNIPETDKKYIWNFVLNKERNFYSVYIDCSISPYVCVIESV
jgi:hypothetical protein